MALYRQVQGSGEVAENTYDLDLDEDDVQQVRVVVCVGRGVELGGRKAPRGRLCVVVVVVVGGGEHL